MNCLPELPQTGFVTLAFVRKRYSISNSTTYSWISSSFLPRPYRIGPRSVRFSIEELRKFEAKFLARNGATG